jgi:hypothetical protein
MSLRSAKLFKRVTGRVEKTGLGLKWSDGAAEAEGEGATLLENRCGKADEFRNMEDKKERALVGVVGEGIAEFSWGSWVALQWRK